MDHGEWDVFVTLGGAAWTLDSLVDKERAEELAEMIRAKLPDADVKVVDCSG